MAYLVLSNGAVFEGERIGAEGESMGELVFTTGMVGYLETLTDPSFAGQIVIQTFPLIGNYGVIEQDFEGECAVKGYVVRELCDAPSNFRSQYDLNTFLKEKGVCGICGVDTRELTRIIREEGVMNAVICDNVPNDLSELKGYEIKGAVEKASRSAVQVCPAKDEKKYSVTVIDYGVKQSIVDSLCSRGCEVKIVPCSTTAQDILADAPDGIVLSNGPGAPEDNAFCIEQIAALMGKVPMLGIGLGHQLAACAMGGSTLKLKYGHRGGNQPVKEFQGKRTFITNQNHGYAVDAECLGEKAKLLYVNANDGSCEGLEYPGKQCFTVQFYPDSSVSPNNTSFIFDRFIGMMGGKADA